MKVLIVLGLLSLLAGCGGEGDGGDEVAMPEDGVMDLASDVRVIRLGGIVERTEILLIPGVHVEYSVAALGVEADDGQRVSGRVLRGDRMHGGGHHARPVVHPADGPHRCRHRHLRKRSRSPDTGRRVRQPRLSGGPWMPRTSGPFFPTSRSSISRRRWATGSGASTAWRAWSSRTAPSPAGVVAFRSAATWMRRYRSRSETYPGRARLVSERRPGAASRKSWRSARSGARRGLRP